MTDRLPYPPPFQDLATLSEHICAAESTIENWVKMGIFPKPRMQGGKRMWSWKAVERHLAGETDAAPSTSDLTGRITNATRQALQGA
jgi:predicted site-specific integrase-resolvase